MPAYKNKENNSWYVVTQYTDWTGERKQKCKRGFSTRREALEWEQKFQQQSAGDLDMTFEAFVEIYTTDLRARLKESTWQTKEHIIRTKILPYFGKRKINEITTKDVIAWQNELLAYRDEKRKPYSQTYLKSLHNQLSAIFNHAVRYYDLHSNPAAKAGNMGNEERREMLFWTKEEYQKFSEVMMDKPVSYYAFQKLGILIATLTFFIVNGLMCMIGPLVRAINPNIAVADYTSMFVATNLLPSWVGGIIFSGVFAAVQSSIAGICISAGAILAKDFIVDCLMKEVPEKTQSRINYGVIIGVGVIGVLVALKPTDITQYMINFALGSIGGGWYWPILLGFYWKKATKTGMILSTIGGYGTYIVCYFLSSIIPYTKAWWGVAMGGVNAFIPAWIVSLICMVAGSLLTQNQKVPLGYYQVFFCSDYDEKYAKLDCKLR